jgi:hypothetical protein
MAVYTIATADRKNNTSSLAGEQRQAPTCAVMK